MENIVCQWVDSFIVALAQKLLIKVHQHLHLVFRQFLGAIEALLLSDLLICHARCERGKSKDFSRLCMELGLIVATESNTSQSVTDKHRLDSLVKWRGTTK